MKDRKDKIRGHARQRAAERYGLNYTKNDRENLLAIIENGQTKNGELLSITKIKPRRFKCELKYRGTELKVIYDSSHKEIMTFLRN